MENIKLYEQFIYEKKETKGISIAIYKDIEKYFKTAKNPNFKEAQEYISKFKKGWKLSDNDFQEGLKKFKK